MVMLECVLTILTRLAMIKCQTNEMIKHTRHIIITAGTTVIANTDSMYHVSKLSLIIIPLLLGTTLLTSNQYAVSSSASSEHAIIQFAIFFLLFTFCIAIIIL